MKKLTAVKTANPSDVSVFTNKFNELVKEVLPLDNAGIKKYIRATFPNYNPAYRLEYKIYNRMPDAKLQISYVYRENEDGTIYFNIDLSEPYTDDFGKNYSFNDEVYG